MVLKEPSASSFLHCQSRMAMEKKRKKVKKEEDPFLEELARSPEWTALKTSGRSSLLYLISITAALGICLCTMYVLLS